MRESEEGKEKWRGEGKSKSRFQQDSYITLL